jgi:hypothetical protein
MLSVCAPALAALRAHAHAQCMLESQQLGAEQLGYDRPSAKLLAFLHRHYGLGRYIPQPNNVRALCCCVGHWRRCGRPDLLQRCAWRC